MVRRILKHALYEPAIYLRRRFDAGRASILYFHRFPQEQAADFRRQCEYLAKHYRVLSMSQLAAALSERRLPPNAAVITVDDGHRDFYTCAFPILRELGLPALMYLPTAFLDGAWLWFDRCQYVFLNSAVECAQWSGAGGLPGASLELGTPAARQLCFEQIARRIQWLPVKERDHAVDELAELLCVRTPEQPTEEYAAMTWDQVRELARHRIEFGGHTVNHPILKTVTSEEALEAEIAGCKRRIEQELQAPVDHFAYPSGLAEEVSQAAREMVAKTGYRTATTTVHGRTGTHDDLLWLPRVGCDPAVEWIWFRRGLVGAR